MNDLISRQDAIDAINTWDKFGADERGRLVRWNEGLEPYVHLRDVLTAIAYLPSAQQWIPCSERLPEKNGRYLVTRGLKACNSIWNRVYIVNYTDLMGLIAEKIWWEGNVGKSDFQKIDDVLAWKPLEEPYKGEQE